MRHFNQPLSGNGLAKGVMLVALLVLLSACFGKGRSAPATTDADGQPVVDMTRPPVTIKGGPAVGEESDPDETVSYEKWKKEQDKPKN